MKSKPIPSWRITKSWVDGEDPSNINVATPVDITGPSDFDETRDFPQKFRLLDDDGNIYYEGVATEDCDFEPLDDYGMPNAGCSEIQYWSEEFQEWRQI